MGTEHIATSRVVLPLDAETRHAVPSPAMKTNLCWMGLMVAVAAACGSDDEGGGGASGTPVTLVKSSAEASCVGGGTKLEFGADKNGNNQLDADEITTSQIVCNEGPAPTLTTVAPSGASPKCKNGGVLVRSGQDANRNGVLDDSEVKETNEICGGGNGVELSKTTAIAEGDVICPFGGSTTESGFDNGANGSVAGDGVLQTGEIVTTTTTCKSGGQFPGSLDAPPGAAGTGQILVSGANGGGGPGGKGGNVQLQMQGTRGGHVKIWKTGVANAAFVTPNFAPVFGATKLEVAANMTIQSRASSGDAADGEYYLLNGNGLFFRQNAGNPSVPVTGVHVAANVTLTFPATGAQLALSDDFHNEGSITTGLTTGNRGTVSMSVAKYIGGATSKIDLAGAANAGGAGGNGGSFTVTADRIVNGGVVDVSGANGDAGGTFAGGTAGTVAFVANRTPVSGPLYNSGAIKSSGGAGKAAGGNGGQVTMLANMQGVFNSAAIDSLGGSGGASGGNAATIQLVAFNGSLRNTGALTSRGAAIDAAACAVTCGGGAPAAIQLISVGGSIATSGDLTSAAGASKGVAGVSGGTIALIAISGSDPLTGAMRAAGDVAVSGKLDARGSAGTVGGNGGTVTVQIAANQPLGQEIELSGYASIEASGGQGTTAGGQGGVLTIANGPSPNNEPSGSAIVHATFTAKGGAATTSGAGGAGGGLTLAAGIVSGPPGKSQAAVVGGAVDLSGGNGVATGGAGGVIDIQSAERTQILAAITSLGGNQTGAAGVGGAVGPTQIRSSTGTFINGAITLRGGNGAGAGSIGGPCTALQIVGGAITTTAALACAGGNGTGAAGGNGGTVNIASSLSPSNVTGTPNVAGGTGTPAGVNGAVAIDGSQL